jgi:hypothetical protein
MISNQSTMKESNLENEIMYQVTHARGYADIFDWNDPDGDRERGKREKEQSVVEDFVQARYHGAFRRVRIQSCPPPLPDCEMIDSDRQKIGIEVTELVDEQTIQRNKAGYNCCKEYSANDLFLAVARRLMAKNQKLLSARAIIRMAGYDRIILIMFCDEPDLNQRPAFCRKVFSSRQFPQFSEIDEAYLLLPCPRKKHLHDFEAEFCQAIPIPLPSKSK